MTKNSWNAVLYQDRHQFVWQYGQDLLKLLAPQSGELILDLGCGTGQLTDKIAITGAKVRGIDFSEEMIVKARQNYPQLQFEVADARDFSVEEPLDGIFSNAVLHWIQPPDAVIRCIEAALKPGGRFVAEFGGKGNVSQIVRALETTLPESYPKNPWYFPSISEYSNLLEKYGLEVVYATLLERPTPLADGENGLGNWLKMFAHSWLSELSPQQQARIIQVVTRKLASTLYQNGTWIADYRRIRVVAFKKN